MRSEKESFQSENREWFRRRVRRRAFQRGHAALVGEARRVVAARVLEALVDARRLLDEGRARVDRRHHRARGRVGVLAAVDAVGREVGWGVRHVRSPRVQSCLRR